MKVTKKQAAKEFTTCPRCGVTFERKATTCFGSVALKVYCSDKCKYETFKQKQQAKIEAKRLADKLLAEAGKKKVNVYREVHRKAREFAKSSTAPVR